MEERPQHAATEPHVEELLRVPKVSLEGDERRSLSLSPKQGAAFSLSLSLAPQKEGRARAYEEGAKLRSRIYKRNNSETLTKQGLRARRIYIFGRGAPSLEFPVHKDGPTVVLLLQSRP